MFKGHPKGLFVAFFANMGERFGFYTMVSIFVLFMQAKYGLTTAQSSLVYTLFASSVYALPILGGLLADKVLGYGRTISLGMIVMFLGYALLSIPTRMETGFILVIAALAVIAIGTGFFKGNLQALVGNLYDDPKYDALRDRAFNIFYMGINIGAMFAPTASEKVSNWILSSSHFTYDARIPALANDFIRGRLAEAGQYLGLAQAQDASVGLETLKSFSERYINALSKSYHFGFGVALLSLILSMLIFWGFRKYYKHADISEKQKSKSETLKSQMVVLTPQQTKERLVALLLVFLIVIFFWMAFQQSPVTHDVLRPRLHGAECGQADEPLVRPDRIALDIFSDRRTGVLDQEKVGCRCPRIGRRRFCRLRRACLPEIPRLSGDQSLPAPAVPAF